MPTILLLSSLSGVQFDWRSYTYGQPFTGQDDFAALMEVRLVDRYLRFVNDEDVVAGCLRATPCRQACAVRCRGQIAHNHQRSQNHGVHPQDLGQIR